MSVSTQDVANPSQDGRVISQSPGPGQQVDRGSTVNLIVGRLGRAEGGGGDD